MLYYLIVCRSLTYAQRALYTLEQSGITAYLTKAPQHMTDSGCGYSIKVSEKRIYDSLAVLNKAGIKPIKVIIDYRNGTFDEAIL